MSHNNKFSLFDLISALDEANEMGLETPETPEELIGFWKLCNTVDPEPGSLVYICSRYAGKNEKEIKDYIRLACGFSFFAVGKKTVPVSPLLLFPQFLQDDVPKWRARGMECALQLMRHCDEVWVFDVNGISERMIQEISRAKELGIPVRYFKAKDLWR